MCFLRRIDGEPTRIRRSIFSFLRAGERDRPCDEGIVSLTRDGDGTRRRECRDDGDVTEPQTDSSIDLWSDLDRRGACTRWSPCSYGSIENCVVARVNWIPRASILEEDVMVVLGDEFEVPIVTVWRRIEGFDQVNLVDISGNTRQGRCVCGEGDIRGVDREEMFLLQVHDVTPEIKDPLIFDVDDLSRGPERGGRLDEMASSLCFDG